MSGHPWSADTDGALDPARYPRAHGAPLGRARLKSEADDFEVEELLGFEPDGAGSHAWLRLRRRDTNTAWLARRLAAIAGVRPVAVGYAGLKDRRALATQWFSVDLAGRAEPRWAEALAAEGVELLACTRHRRKLRRGAHRGNRFVLRLRGLAAADQAALAARLAAIRRAGVPAYFGTQRFGRDGANLERAAAILLGARRERDRQRRSLALSAARALLFNRVLARRVGEGSWARALPGEVLMLEGGHSVFPCERPDEAIAARLAALDLHPTGPLPGRGGLVPSGEALACERAALAGLEDWLRGLAHAGLAAARRALRVAVHDLDWAGEGKDGLRLSFRLAPGAYATMVVRELCEVDLPGPAAADR